jgi:hypothetical protein
LLILSLVWPKDRPAKFEVVSAWAAILALITVNASNSLLKVMDISSFTVLFGYGARLLTFPCTAPEPSLNPT